RRLDKTIVGAGLEPSVMGTVDAALGQERLWPNNVQRRDRGDRREVLDVVEGNHESTKTRRKPTYFSCFRGFVVAFFCELCVQTSHFSQAEELFGGHEAHARLTRGEVEEGAHHIPER